jgi:hypothetical protein
VITPGLCIFIKFSNVVVVGITMCTREGGRDKMPPGLDGLSDYVLDRILFHLADDVADLLHLSRASKRYYSTVLGADSAWKRAYVLSFGTLEHLLSAPGATTPATSITASTSNTLYPQHTWLERYKARFAEEGRKRRQLAAAQLLKARSAVQALEQLVHQLSHILQKEKKEMRHRSESLFTLRALMQAGELQPAHTYWAPTAVTQAHGSVVVQVPQNASERERELQNTLAVSNLESTKLERMLAANKEKLRLAKLRLQALQP